MEIDNTTDSVGPIQNNIGEHQYEVDTSPSQNPCQNMQAPQTLYTWMWGHKLHTYSGVSLQLTMSIHPMVRGRWVHVE